MGGIKHQKWGWFIIVIPTLLRFAEKVDAGKSRHFPTWDLFGIQAAGNFEDSQTNVDNFGLLESITLW